MPKTTTKSAAKKPAAKKTVAKKPATKPVAKKTAPAAKNTTAKAAVIGVIFALLLTVIIAIVVAVVSSNNKKELVCKIQEDTITIAHDGDKITGINVSEGAEYVDTDIDDANDALAEYIETYGGTVEDYLQDSGYMLTVFGASCALDGKTITEASSDFLEDLDEVEAPEVEVIE